MIKWDEDHDPIYVEALASGDRSLLIDRVQKALSVLVVSHGMKPRSIEYARRKVASWVVSTWNPNKISGNSLASRGRLKHLVSEIHDATERQAFAGRYTAAVRADQSIERLVEAWNRCIADGQGIPSKSALAQASGLSRQTVHNRFADLQEALAQRGVKNALMLYRQGDYAHPEKPSQIIRQLSANNKPSESNSTRNSTIDSLVIANDNQNDEEALAEHEAWIAFQENRACRDEVMETVVSLVSKSSQPALRHWQRYGETPTAFDTDDDYIVCPPGGLFCPSDAVKAA